jgi:hypothetical protein
MLRNLLYGNELDCAVHDPVNGAISAGESNRALMGPRASQLFVVISGNFPHLVKTAQGHVVRPGAKFDRDVNRQRSQLFLRKSAQDNKCDGQQQGTPIR